MSIPTQEELLVLEQMSSILEDIACSHRDLRRDLDTLRRRFLNEGFCFLSVTIPKLGKAFDRALDGVSAFTPVNGFARLTGTVLPRFMGSMLRRVFNEDGTLVSSLDYSLVKNLRTFFYYAYKVSVDFSPSVISRYEDNFIKTDEDVSEYSDFSDIKPLINLCAHQLRELDSIEFASPTYGPGVSANCGRDDVYTSYHPISTDAVIALGPSYFYQWDDPRVHSEILYLFLTSFIGSFVTDIPPGEKFNYAPSKVIFVPKDSRGPLS